MVSNNHKSTTRDYKMVIQTDLVRIVTTARDFEVVGLNIIGYYLRLYAVEEILTEKDRSNELTKIATDQLDAIENFKNEINSDDTGETDSIKVLLNDQEKAKVYVLNFAMSLYNGKLLQLKEGPWDMDLRRGLWCSIDLIGCILHLWKDTITNEDQLKKKIKYCKVYLSKLAKGEIGGVEGKRAEEKLDYADFISADSFVDDINKTDKSPGEKEVNSLIERVTSEENDATNREPETAEILSEDEIDYQKPPTENEIKNLIARAKALEDGDEEDKRQEETPEGSSLNFEPSSFKLPSVPNFKPRDLPTFIDDDEDATENLDVEDANMLNNSLSTEEEIRAPVAQYSKDEIMNMMDRSEKIEQIQRLAKYAISALNYEDLHTAKDELTRALKLLNSL